MVNGSGGPAVGGVVKAGSAVFAALSDVGIVAVLTVYFLADMPRIRATLYRLVPGSRRPRAFFSATRSSPRSVTTSLATWQPRSSRARPPSSGVSSSTSPTCYCSVFFAILDLIPYGSTVAGFVVAAVALTVSIPVSIATVAFYIVFRWFEDYLLVPKVIGRAVKVPGGVTVVAVLIGAALLGIVGALVAIPVAAALQLLAQELLFPALDEA